MMAWASDPEVAAFCRWEPYVSTEALLAYIRDTVLPHQWFRAICLADDGRPVGAVSLEPTADRCRGELVYVVARAHWGRGVATAAVRSALVAVFIGVEGLARVEALVDVDNAASQRVAEKGGFPHFWPKGRVRDLVMYDFVSGDPLPRSHETRRSMEQEAADRTPERADNKVTFRPFDLADVDTIAAWASGSVLVPPTASMAWGTYLSPSRDVLLAFLRNTALPHPWFRAVCLGGAVVGAVSVTPTDDRCRAERVDADDTASRRALEDAGFRGEAVLRSHRAVVVRLRDVAVYSLISIDDPVLH